MLKAALAAETIITCGIDDAMNKFNTKKKEARNSSWATVHV